MMGAQKHIIDKGVRGHLVTTLNGILAAVCPAAPRRKQLYVFEKTYRNHT